MDYKEKVDRSLEFIHNNISERLTTEIISKHVYLSRFHFHRIFHSLTGESMMDYVNKYRIEKAGDELVNTDSRIVDTALKYGFCSQEHFTNSFRKYYGITPGEYRRNGVIIHHLPLSLYEKRDYTDIIDPEPVIVGFPSVLIAGMSAHCSFSNVLPRAIALWKQLNEKIDRIPGPVTNRVAFGIFSLPDNDENREQLEYTAGIQVSGKRDLPREFRYSSLPASDYAVFRCHGQIERIEEAYDFIYGRWLSGSGYELSCNVQVERYYEKNPENGEVFDICIPVR